MQPACNEPGRNGDHRFLEFFAIIIAAAANLHTDLSDGEICLA
jgi:hypothetical protein